MKMTILCLTCLMLTGGGVSAIGQTTDDERAKNLPATNPPVDDQPAVNPALIEAGKALLDRLNPLPVGATQPYYFELLMGPEQTIGYAGVELSASRQEGQFIYRYEVESVISFPSGDTLVSTIAAKLRSNFEPIEVEGWRARISPEGEQTNIFEKAVIGKDKVILITGEGEQRTTREVPRPEPPFVFGMDCVAARLDLTKSERFFLREFNMSTGGARDLTLGVESWKDGTPTLVTFMRGDIVSYQFWYDRSGQLTRWAEGSMPMMFTRVAKARFDELQRLHGRFGRDLLKD